MKNDELYGPPEEIFRPEKKRGEGQQEKQVKPKLMLSKFDV